MFKQIKTGAKLFLVNFIVSLILIPLNAIIYWFMFLFTKDNKLILLWMLFTMILITIPFYLYIAGYIADKFWRWK